MKRLYKIGGTIICIGVLAAIAYYLYKSQEYIINVKPKSDVLIEKPLKSKEEPFDLTSERDNIDEILRKQSKKDSPLDLEGGNLDSTEFAGGDNNSFKKPVEGIPITITYEKPSSINRLKPLALAQDPLTAFREPHKLVISDSEFNEYIATGRNIVKEIGQEYAWDQRGFRLLVNLNSAINDCLNKDTLLILMTGNLHTPIFEWALSESFNTYYFSEYSYLISEIEFKEDAESFAQRCVRYNATKSKPYDPHKLDCIIFGDSHGQDFEFEKYMPDQETIRKRGIKKIIFAEEHYGYKKIHTLIKSYQRMVDYLENIKGVEIIYTGMKSAK